VQQETLGYQGANFYHFQCLGPLGPTKQAAGSLDQTLRHATSHIWWWEPPGIHISSWIWGVVLKISKCWSDLGIIPRPPPPLLLVPGKGCGMAASIKNQSWLNWGGGVGRGPEIFLSVGMTWAAQGVKFFPSVFDDLGGSLVFQ
jgi:hypothetical protein